jgi:outer membrane protein TolC
VALVDVDVEPVDTDLGGLGEQLRTLAGSQPTARAADRGGAAMRSLADAKWSELYPELFLGAYFSYSGSTVADDQGSPYAHDPWNSWYGGAALGLRYQLDIPQRVARARQAGAEAERTVWLGRVAAAEAALELETAHREAGDLAELLPTYRRAERAARSWLVAKSDLYDAGFATLDDVTDALVEFFKRRLGYLRAVHDYNLAVARLTRALGSAGERPDRPPAAGEEGPDGGASPEGEEP